MGVLKQYRLLQQVEERVLYCDTESLINGLKEGEVELEFGN